MPQFYNVYNSVMNIDRNTRIWELLHPHFRCPIDNDLIEKWSHTSKFEEGKDLAVYLKKLLIYYPKKPKSLRPLNKFFTSQEIMEGFDKRFNITVKKLVLAVLSKYKKSLLRQLCIGLFNRTVPVEKLGSSVEKLIVFPGLAPMERPLLALKKFFVNNKRLRVALVFEDWIMPLCISGWFQYLRCLESVKIKHMDFISSRENYRIFHASSRCLKELTIFGSLNHTYTKIPGTLVGLLNVIADLKVLERFKLDTFASGKFVVDKIPFEKFAEKNISFDIKLHKCNAKVNFSRANAAALSSLNTLGLVLRDYYSVSDEPLFQQYHETIDRNSRQTLHLDLYNRFNLNLVLLLRACKNISTLSLVMPKNSGVELDFEPLQEFCNLKNLYIQLGDFGHNSINLFNNLTICSRERWDIETFYLNIEGNIVEEYSLIVPVFEACAKTLTKFAISINYYNKKQKYRIDGMKYIHQALSKLKALKSLTVKFKKVGTVTEELAQTISQLDLLEEFSLSIPFGKEKGPLNLQFNKPTKLKKFELEIFDLECLVNFPEKLRQLRCLKYLRLMLVRMNKKTWKKLRKTVKCLRKLKTFILECTPEFEIEELESEMEILFKKHESLTTGKIDYLYNYYIRYI